MTADDDEPPLYGATTDATVPVYLKKIRDSKESLPICLSKKVPLNLITLGMSLRFLTGKTKARITSIRDIKTPVSSRSPDFKQNLSYG